MPEDGNRSRRVRRLTPASQFDAGTVKSMLSQQISKCAHLDSTVESEAHASHVAVIAGSLPAEIQPAIKESAGDEDGLSKSGECSPFHRQALLTNANKRSSLRRRSTKDSGYGDVFQSGDDDDDDFGNGRMQPITERHFSRGDSVSSDCDDEAMESCSSDCGSVENSPFSTRRRRVTPVPLSASKMKEALQLQFRGSSECMFVEEEDVEDVAQFNSDNDFVGRTINMKPRKKPRGYVKSSSFDCLRLALAQASRQAGSDKQRIISLSYDDRRGCATDDDDDRSDDVSFRPLETRSLHSSPVMTRNATFPFGARNNNNNNLGNAKASRYSAISSSDDDETVPHPSATPSTEESQVSSSLPMWMLEAQASIESVDEDHTSHDEASTSDGDVRPRGCQSADRPITPSSPVFLPRNDETKSKSRRKQQQADPPRLMTRNPDDSDDAEENFILRLKRTANRKKPTAKRKLTPSSTKPVNLDKLHSLRDHLSKCTLTEE